MAQASRSLGTNLWLASKAVAAALLAFGEPIWAAIVYFVPDPWLLWNIASPASRGFGPVASRFETDRREVWLTIDDGPHPDSTPAILDLLDRHGAKATFFLIGQAVERYPELAQEIVRSGHTIGNHTHTHPCWTLWGSGAKQIGTEIDSFDLALTRAGLERPAYFRVPVGIKTPFVHPALARRGMSLVAWSVRGFDAISDAEQAARRMIPHIRPGAIVLLHEGPRCRAGIRVVELVLEFLQREGYRAVVPAAESLR